MEFNATLLVSAISFILFVLIMNKILYEPITRIVQARHDYLRANEDAVLEHKQKAQAVLEEKEAKLSDANKQAKEAIFGELESSKEVKNQVLQEKKSEIAEKIKAQKDDISNEKNQLGADIATKTEDLSSVIASKIFESTGGLDV